MPMSLTIYSRSPTSRGEGVSGAPRLSVQATCVRVTSPLPSTRTASSDGSLNPVAIKTSPWPYTGRGTFENPSS